EPEARDSRPPDRSSVGRRVGTGVPTRRGSPRFTGQGREEGSTGPSTRRSASVATRRSVWSGHGGGQVDGPGRLVGDGSQDLGPGRGHAPMPQQPGSLEAVLHEREAIQVVVID